MPLEPGLATQPRRGRAITVRTPGRHGFADPNNRVLTEELAAEPQDDDLLELEADDEEETTEAVVHDDSEELDVMQAAVFALSRIEDEQTVPRLIAIARTHREPEIRRVALIWLGRTKDPRALALFEEILARRM